MGPINDNHHHQHNFFVMEKSINQNSIDRKKINGSGCNLRAETTHGAIENDSSFGSTTFSNARNTNSYVHARFDEVMNGTPASCFNEGNECNLMEVELRLRIRRLDEENASLRDELVRSEDSATLYERQAYKIQQTLDRVSANVERLQKENDEQKELIDILEEQEKRYQINLQKIEKDRQAEIQKLQLDNKKLASTIEIINQEKCDCLKHLRQCNTKLTETNSQFELLKSEHEELARQKSVLKDYYEKEIRTLQDKIDDLRDENSRVLITDCNKSSFPEFQDSMTLMDEDNWSFDYSPDSSAPQELQESLYAELKASGISPEKCKYQSIIAELEDDVKRYNTEIYRVIQQIDKIIENLIQNCHVKIVSKVYGNLEDEHDNRETIPVEIVAKKISTLSDAVTNALIKIPKNDASSQVSFDNDPKSLDEFKILSFKKTILHPPIERNEVTKGKNKIQQCKNKRIIKKSSSTVGVKNSKCLTKMSDKIVPRRKLSVFQRSFDIDTVFETTQDDTISENHILSERPATKSRLSPQIDLPENSLLNNPISNILNNPPSEEENSTKLPGTCPDNSPSTSYDATAKTSIKISLAPSKLNYLFTKKKEMDIVGETESEKIDCKQIIHQNFNLDMKKSKDISVSTGNVFVDDSSAIRKLSEGNAPKDQVTINKNFSTSSLINPREIDEDPAKLTSNDASQQQKSLTQLESIPLKLNDNNLPTNPERNIPINNNYNNLKNNNNNNNDEKNQCQHKITKIKRSLSIGGRIDYASRDSDENSCYTCTSKTHDSKKLIIDLKKNNEQPNVTAFPSFTEAFLEDTEIESHSRIENKDLIDLPEDELERKYVAFSIGLFTDRVTLSRRRAISIRQRDRTENNLVSEMFKMQQDIQALAPLCLDSETVERIERARNQIDILLQCAQKVSYAAETLGAIQQEYRVSRAVYLTDKYLKVLRNRCSKYAIDLAETKRILSDNNIIINENNGESTEELSSALRYRGLPNSTNRTMIARRRASIATIFRPFGSTQELPKDNPGQREFLPTRLTLRKPSISSSSQLWEAESLKRAESTDSLGELKEIFEQAESRRVSREENNNNFPRSQLVEWERDSTEVSSNIRKQQPIKQPLQSFDQQPEKDSRSRKAVLALASVSSRFFTWRLIILSIVIVLVVSFYVKNAMSFDCYPMCSAKSPFKWWSIEEIIDRHIGIRKVLPRPV